MDIKIGKPLSFSEIGQKDNQEDYVFPTPQAAGKQDKVFILCDGMGGHSHGEVASRTVATSLGEYMQTHFPADGVMTKERFNQGLDYAYSQLNLVDDGSVRKMGTTLTFVCFHKDGCFCAHIGDSRIYIIRPAEKKIVYRSEDHSLVNDLLRAGEISPEEAASYPRKNVITRAMQPNQEKPAKAEIHNIQDICAGDYVFLCCDGILEHLSEDKLMGILSSPKCSDNTKISAIKSVCFDNTRDNFTCYLIPVDAVISSSTANTQGKQDSFLSRKYSVTAKGWIWLVCLLALLFLFATVAYVAYDRGTHDNYIKEEYFKKDVNPKDTDVDQVIDRQEIPKMDNVEDTRDQQLENKGENTGINADSSHTDDLRSNGQLESLHQEL